MSQPPSLAEDLQRAIALSEIIKKVVRQCFEINMMGINAILLSRKAGDTARGFGVVSTEIRQLSDRLQANMNEIHQAAFTLVNEASSLLKRTRRVEIMRRTLTEKSEISDFLKQVFDRYQHDFDQIQSKLLTLRKALRAQVEDSFEACVLGVAISRTAKIESVYAGASSTVLSEVSHRFEAQIDQMLGSMTSLKQILQTR